MKRFIVFLREKENAIAKLVPLVLGIYFFLICCPYIFARISALDHVFSNSTIAFVLRFLFLLLYGIFAVILMISKRIKVNWQWLIPCIFVYLIFILSCLVTPKTIISYSLYFTGKASVTNTTVGVYSCLVHLVRFGGDLFFFYFLVTVYPYGFKNRNQFSLIVLVATLIALVAVGYSLIFERSTIQSVLNGGDPGKLMSIFHSKNEYGIFLFTGSMAAAFVFFSDTRRWTKLFIITLPIFATMSFICNCKMAAVCIVVLLFFCPFYAIFRYFNTRKWFSITLIALISLLSLLTILFFAVPAFHSSGFLKSLYDKILDSFKNFSLDSFFGRTSEWGVVGRFVTGGFMLIGFYPAVGYNYITAYTSINASATITVYDLHNAYVDFYAYHGIIGITFLFCIYIYLIYKLVKLHKKDRSLTYLLIGLFVCSVLYGMAETYTLFVSMSANTFALNLILLGVTIFETKDSENKDFLRNKISLLIPKKGGEKNVQA